MTANFAFIAHATQRDADKFASRRAGHRFAQRRLAHARRANKAQNRALQLLRTLLNRQIFDNPFLDLLKAIMVFVQNLLRAPKVLLHAALDAPWDRQDPIQVIAYNGGLSRHR